MTESLHPKLTGPNRADWQNLITSEYQEKVA
jgi:hypothetical protein